MPVPLTLQGCEVEFFAPHQPTGHRLDPAILPTVNKNTGVITATTLGVYLFQVRWGQLYIVGRLQVHKAVQSWWFGNDSITTAKDDKYAHAQPSIYARFSDAPEDRAAGTDLIGDITGHGYVTLTSSDISKVVVSPDGDGRLRGLVETPEPPPGAPPPPPVTVSGTFLNQSNSLPVRVVDYSKPRNDLFPLQAPSITQFEQKHNIVFLAEGFRKEDEELFNKIVTDVTGEMFDKPRHEPYPMLEGSFNAFKAFAPSQQHVVTCGFHVTDEKAGLDVAGYPIPLDERVEGDGDNIYTLRELVIRVGLPMRGEHRLNLKDNIWNGQGLKDFEVSKVSDRLVEAWKVHRPVGILHARDTFFGMHLGQRLADRSSGFSANVVASPATGDDGSDALKKFVARLYEFYQTAVPRIPTPDPRRHPPKLYARGFVNVRDSILRYVGGLQYFYAPHQPIGQVWLPDDTKFKPSRGLIALVIHDGLDGGANINNKSMLALTLDSVKAVRFRYANPADKREMRRDPPPQIEPDLNGTVNTIAHEFGHSFNLDDEYEEFRGDNVDTATTDLTFDNVTRLGFLRIGNPPSREINPDKVKWFTLPRMRISASLLEKSVADSGGIKVKIDLRYIGQWVQAKKENAEVHLRNFEITPTGQQLDLNNPAQRLTGLTIRDDPDQAHGTFVLTKAGLPTPPPVFDKGSAVYVPLKDKNGELVLAVEKKVLDFLRTTRHELNQDPNHVIPRRGEESDDHPVSIPGFKAPCHSASLVGIFEGAARYAGGYYRPTGECKMRNSGDDDEGGAFCYVCKWLIVNRVDPSYHDILSKKFYPKAKKNG